MQTAVPKLGAISAVIRTDATLSPLAQAAIARGFERVFLQVEAQNDPALSLYRRAGFEPQWQYSYWQRQQ